MNDTLRSRLEALNRGPLPADATAVEHAKQVIAAVKSDAPFRQPPKLPHPAAPTASSPPARRVGLLRRGEEIETPFGKHLRIDLPIDQLWHGGANLIAARQAFLRRLADTAAAAIEPTVLLEREFAAFVQALPDRTIALDLETCGLAGSALFLIGLLRQVDGQPIVQLLLARNYAEEPAVLWSLWTIIGDHDVLLTFNGKSFDWPMVVERSIRHRLQVPATRDLWTHIDILHHARRRYKRQLPNCRLQTLERFVCRRTREGDIPGHAIPAAYANFVRTGFEREMDEILHHNALDLVTLFDLAHRLAA
ncbi:MAG TPA: ribonuclease H-like domain-containing protein [Lacipirellulaceae bacterium]|jgi:uncharacterized protein YprB with RNaseH-like and TPR domain|nr:ribonuclease H-like domain-containing protein [Lacipirellulaceae bacterium]